MLSPEKCLRWLSSLAIIACLLIYCFMDIFSDLFYQKYVIVESYFVNTSGCRILTLKPYNTEIYSHWKLLKPDVCKANSPLIGVSDEFGNYLQLNETLAKALLLRYNLTELGQLNCSYFAVERHNDFSNWKTYTKHFELELNMKLEIKPTSDIVHVGCRLRNKPTIFHQVYFFIRPPRTANGTLKGTGNAMEMNQSRETTSRRLSVMILGIDSVSHMHFLRALPHTTNHMRTLPHVEFFGYNRVGRNSFPNLMPLLAGLSDNELIAACLQDKKDFDKCQLIWQDFKAAGYSTSFGEDNTDIGTFTYNKPGFHDQPTDYYLRPVVVETQRYKLARSNQGSRCNGGSTFGQLLWEFVDKLLPLMQRQSFFSFFWWTQGVHDSFSYARSLDDNLMERLQRFELAGLLNDTLLLIMSDHGMRFGSYRHTYQGMLEENQPVLFAIYPRWLEHEYPQALANLKRNSKSLITTYDLHATLRDVLSLRNLADELVLERTDQLRQLGVDMPRGISLFLPIPDARDCDLAGIPTHFCSCHTLSELPISTASVQRAARFMVQSINQLLRPEAKCQSLSLDRVLKGYIWSRRQDDRVFEIKVRAQTTPGLGHFEGTVRFSGYLMAMDGPITRLNQYGNQSYCVHNYLIEMYCYCA